MSVSPLLSLSSLSESFASFFNLLFNLLFNNPLCMKKKQGMQKPRLGTSSFCTPPSPVFRVRVTDLSLWKDWWELSVIWWSLILSHQVWDGTWKFFWFFLQILVWPLVRGWVWEGERTRWGVFEFFSATKPEVIETLESFRHYYNWHSSTTPTNPTIFWQVKS